MFLGTYDIDEYVPIPAVTHRFSSGAAYAPTAITYSIYEEGNTTGLDEDVNMTPASPFDSVVGAYYVRRQLTAAAGFERGKTYVVIVKATVDSVAAIEMHIFQMRYVLTRSTGAIVADAGNSTTAFKTNLTSSEDDYIKDAYVKFTSGADINQVKKISAYNGTSKVITTAAFTDEPAENDTFVIINE